MEFVAEGGEVINLLNLSPIKVKKRLMEAAGRWCISKGLSSLGCDSLELVERVEWSWASKALHSIRLSSQESGGLRATIDGSAWTEARMYEAGYLLTDECQCMADTGDTPHRVLRCLLNQEDRSKMEAASLEAAKQQELDEALCLRISRLIPIREQGIERGPQEEMTVAIAAAGGYEVQLHEQGMSGMEGEGSGEALVIDGVLADLGHFSPEILEACRVWRAERGRTGAKFFEGAVFTDGSAVDATMGRFARAGAAIIQLEGAVTSGEVSLVNERSAVCPVGFRGMACSLAGHRETSSDGELRSMELAVKAANPPLRIFTDYKLIIDGLKMGRKWCTDASKAQACRWKRIWGEIGEWPEGSIEAVHVKAHREAGEVGNDREKLLWIGNYIADLAAKCAARQRQADRAVIGEYKKDKRNYLELARLAAKVMVKCSEERPWKKEGRRWVVFGEDRAVREQGRKHVLFQDGKGTARCLHCPQFASTRSSQLKMKSTACKGPMQERVGDSLGRRLMWPKDIGGGELSGVLWCNRCGSYAESAPRALARRCQGHQSRAGKINISWFKRGWHPRQVRRLEEPVRVTARRSLAKGLGGVGVERGRGERRGLEAGQGGDPGDSTGVGTMGRGISEGTPAAFEGPPDEVWEELRYGGTMGPDEGEAPDR